MSIPQYLLKHWRFIILLILAFVFFFIYSWFSYETSRGGDVRFPSPDATTNYFWAEKLSESAASLAAEPLNEPLSYYEPLNIIADDIIVPRSMRSDKGIVKPASFLGIILIYGFIAKIFGSGVIIYLTPFFAVMGVLFFYGIIRRVFSENVAFISALMLLPLAPYWYFTSRSIFHNVLFIDLVLAGVWLLINGRGIARNAPTRMFITFLSGIFIGLAIITRTSEVVWLGPMIALLWIVYFKKVHWDKVVLFLCGIFLALIPMFYYNQVLYGGPLTFAYTAPQKNNEEVVEYTEEKNNGIALSSNSTNAAVFLAMTEKFLPFGFDIKTIGRSFINYYVMMFWYLFWPAFLGGLWFLYNYKKWKKKHWLYFISFVSVSVILGIYYGSWQIQDNPDPNSITIGNSYTRYWLPMYIMSLPLASLLLVKLTDVLKNKYARNTVLTILIITFFVLNWQTSVYGHEEGLMYAKNNLIKDKETVQSILPLIEDDAIVIRQRFDKIFFTGRRVIAGFLVDEEMNKRYAKLAEQVPVYYFGFIFPEKDINYLNNEELLKVGLQVEDVRLWPERRLGLYKINNRHSP